MAVFICRWPNGDFSIVQANTRAGAIARLDEFGDADEAIIRRMSACMFDFGLDDRGEIVFNTTGEETREIIRKVCYPELDAVFAVLGDPETPEGKRQIRESVKLERSRLADTHPKRKPAKTEIGRQLQKETGMSGAVADRYIKRAAKQILETDRQDEAKKPN